MKKGYHHTDEYKKKMSETLKGRIFSEEWKRKISEANKGRIPKSVSEETRRKLSLIGRGKKRSEETKQRIRLVRLGTKRSEETKRKIAIAAKGRIPWNKGKSGYKQSFVSCEKRSISVKKAYKEGRHAKCMLGKHHTNEIRNLISISSRARKHTEETKRKMMGRYVTEETRKRLSLKLKGKKRSDISKINIKNACKYRKHTYFTSIEKIVMEWLKKLNITFEAQKYINNISLPYHCDIYVPQNNLIIECDGNFWHNFPDGKEKDHIRTKEMINNGYKVLRLWESDIREMDIELFKEKLGVIQ
jgi:very-short-patch-repair endonuclease